MQTKQKSNIIATVGTIIFMLLLFLLLWFVYIGAPVDDEDPGIEVAFGNVEELTSAPAESVPAAAAVPEVSVPAPPAPAAPAENLLKQDDESEALAIAEKERKRKEAEALEEARRQKALADAAAAKAAAEKAVAEKAAAEAAAKAAAERKAKEDAARAKAGAMAGLFGNGNNTGSANGSGGNDASGRKGNPVGKGSGMVGGNGWSLAGRDAKTIPQPGNNFNQEGKVVVRIQVNAQGQVVNATVDAGSTISDKATQQLAIEAAKKATFTASEVAAQYGTITYNFKFK